MNASAKLSPRAAAGLIGEEDILSNLAGVTDLNGLIAALATMSASIGGVAIQCASISGDFAPCSFADPDVPVGQAIDDDQFISLVSTDGGFERVSERINDILLQHSRAERPDVPDEDRIITIKVSTRGPEILHERFPAGSRISVPANDWLSDAQMQAIAERLMADYPVAVPPRRALPN